VRPWAQGWRSWTATPVNMFLGALLRLCRPRSHLNLQASFRQYARCCFLAALVLEIDTIPKPDGLGRLMHTVHIELNSIDFEPCSKSIDNCSTAFDFECRSARSRRDGAPTLTIITRTLSVLINIKATVGISVTSTNPRPFIGFNPRPALSCGATHATEEQAAYSGEVGHRFR
jgi:hypothetical protein